MANVVNVKIKPRCDLGSLCHKCYVEKSFCWVSKQYNFIYHETPKCGSSTIKVMLDGYTSLVQRISSKWIDECFSFSFVRNPWDRMVSLYHAFFFDIRPGNKIRKRKIVKRLFKAPHLTFEEFIECLPNVHNHHWEQLSIFIPDDIDFIGRFENFEKDLDKILNIIGLSELEIIHKAKTDHRNYTEYYKDQKHIDIVRELFSDDINRFKYSFGE